MDLVALSIGLHGSEHWIAWLCPNGFGGSIFMDWVALPPWNTQSPKQSKILEFQLKNMTRKNNYIESTNRIYMEPIIFHLIMSIELPKKYAIIQVGKRITSLHE